MFLKYHLQGYLRGRISSIGKCIYFLKNNHRDEFNGISHARPNFEKNDPGAETDFGPAGPRSSES
jgi:hypothetical protein